MEFYSDLRYIFTKLLFVKNKINESGSFESEPEPQQGVGLLLLPDQWFTMQKCCLIQEFGTVE